jgi:hypothetical protein
MNGKRRTGAKKEQSNFGLNQNDSTYNQKELSKKNQRMKTTKKVNANATCGWPNWLFPQHNFLFKYLIFIFFICSTDLVAM